jgi:FkbM family methyltransferase
VLFWKSIAPDAEVTAFEADPAIARVLEANVAAAGLSGVTVIPAAVWTSAGSVTFTGEGADAGRIGGREIVPAVRLADYLLTHVDLLKIDIEGAEVPVLLDCGERLRNVERIVLEYHSFFGEEQRLGELVTLLENVGFRLIMDTEYALASPLNDPLPEGPTDNRLVLYGVRPETHYARGILKEPIG